MTDREREIHEIFANKIIKSEMQVKDIYKGKIRKKKIYAMTGSELKEFHNKTVKKLLQKLYNWAKENGGYVMTDKLVEFAKKYSVTIRE